MDDALLHDHDRSLPFAEYGKTSTLGGTLLERTSVVDSPARDPGTSKIRKVASLLRRKPSFVGHTLSNPPLFRPTPAATIAFPSTTSSPRPVPSSPRTGSSSGLSAASRPSSSSGSSMRGLSAGGIGRNSEEGGNREGRGPTGGMGGDTVWRKRGRRSSTDFSGRGKVTSEKGMAIPHPRQLRGTSLCTGF